MIRTTCMASVNVGLHRQRYLEAGATANVSHGPNFTAVQARGCAANREPKPDADDVAFGAPALEFLEQAVRIPRRQSRSVVCDHQQHAVLLQRGGYRNCGTG